MYDRALLLWAKRDDELTLQEVQQYGIDSFSDADYVSIYGMPPAEWYGRGIRLLGRTAVECTRDALADRMGREIAAVIAKWPVHTRFVVIDPFAGSCNTLYWILRHVANSEGLAFEFDPKIYELSKRNVAHLDRSITLVQGDYQRLLEANRVRDDLGIIVFVAPPWGDALNEVAGLDLRRTTPPIAEVIRHVRSAYAGRKILFATRRSMRRCTRHLSPSFRRCWSRTRRASTTSTSRVVTTACCWERRAGGRRHRRSCAPLQLLHDLSGMDWDLAHSHRLSRFV